MSAYITGLVLLYANPGAPDPDQPQCDPIAKAVLGALAHRADDDGTKAFPSQHTLARYIGCSDRTIRRKLIELEEEGWIYRGDQQHVAHYAPHLRPIVYNIDLHRLNEVRETVEATGPSRPTPPDTQSGGTPDTQTDPRTHGPVTPGQAVPPPPDTQTGDPGLCVRDPRTLVSDKGSFYSKTSREGGVGNSPRTPASPTTPHPPTTELEPAPAPSAAADPLTGEVLPPISPASPGPWTGRGWVRGGDTALSPLSPSNAWHDVGGSRPPLAADEVPRQYPERCLTHQTADWVAESCFACRDARQAVADARTAANSAVERKRRDELTAAADARRRDIEHCQLCDHKGYLPGRKGEIPNRVCSHDADENNRRHRGLAAARQQLATAGGTTYQPEEA